MFLQRKNSSSERPRTGGILIRSEFCIKNSSFPDIHGSMSGKSVHGCTLLDSLFQKAYGKCVLRYAAAENAQRIRADRDVRGSAQ